MRITQRAMFLRAFLELRFYFLEDGKQYFWGSIHKLYHAAYGYFSYIFYEWLYARTKFFLLVGQTYPPYPANPAHATYPAYPAYVTYPVYRK